MAEKWWQKSVFYQIYPRSFQDSNDDGMGDIPGIIERLDYLHTLGIDGIWLSPIYASPNADNGYDISDYYSIMPGFGTMEDFERLISEAKKRDIRIIMDLVVNHTSDEHPWFIEAKKGNKKYREYYVLRRGQAQAAPNDLRSFFGGSAWTFDEELDAYYLHLFDKKQPDLNWENPAMRKEIWEMMNFWLAKGIGGFRLDVIDLIGKKPDASILGDGPFLHTYLQEMHENTLKNFDVVTIGETGGVTPETAPLFTSPDRKELSMVFQFQHIALDEIAGKTKWALKELAVPELKQVLSKWQTELPLDAWNSLFWSNHDQPRILSRWGSTDYPLESGKMLAILLHCMRGTPFIYQGEELGMTNQKVTTLNELSDVESINYYLEQMENKADEQEVWRSINTKGRDNARTPMQWDSSEHAGFSTVEPWYTVNPNYPTINAANSLADSNSLFFTYQRLIQLRKEHPLLIWGDYQLLDTADQVFAYKRSYQGKSWLICANFSPEQTTVSFSDTITSTILSNYEKDYTTLINLSLHPFETFVVEVKE